MEILRFITAGNVDDGKSTLIGRLLYDTGNIKRDILQSISLHEASENTLSFGEGRGEVNLAHLTDGLRAERAQGITIDVAYKYFATKIRKYIVTDAPGHFQYTKNLVTGASNVDVMIILVDAQNGITAQTKRHSLVASFLGIKNILLAINKMDAVEYSRQVFTEIEKEFKTIAKKLQLHEPVFIPISALNGDNVTAPSVQMSWYSGPTLLQYLENYTPLKPQNQSLRFSVQCNIKSTKEGFEKGFAGKILSGSINVGDPICVYPGEYFTEVHKILHGYSEVKQANIGENICVYINNGVELKRGDLISHLNRGPQYGYGFDATICWLNDKQPLQLKKEYILRINSKEVKCKISSVDYIIDNDTFEKTNATSVEVNQFAKVKIETNRKLAYDEFAKLPETGRGIIIDLESNETSGAFVIL